jgi:hypothetical protein
MFSSSKIHNTKQPRMSTSNPNYPAHRRAQLAEASRRSRAERKLLDAENIALSQQLDELQKQHKDLQAELNELELDKLLCVEDHLNDNEQQQQHELLVLKTMQSTTFLNEMLTLSQHIPQHFLVDDIAKLSWRINEAIDESKFTCMRLMDASSSLNPFTTTTFHHMMSHYHCDSGRTTCALAFDGVKRTPVLRVDWRRPIGSQSVKHTSDMKQILNQFLPSHQISVGASEEIIKWGVQTHLVPEFSYVKTSSEEELRTLRQYDGKKAWTRIVQMQQEEQVLGVLQPAYTIHDEPNRYKRGVVKCLTAVVATITQDTAHAQVDFTKQQFCIWQEEELMHISMIASLPSTFSFGPLVSRESVVSKEGQLGGGFIQMMRLGV